MIIMSAESAKISIIVHHSQLYPQTLYWNGRANGNFKLRNRQKCKSDKFFRLFPETCCHFDVQGTTGKFIETYLQYTHSITPIAINANVQMIDED